MASATNTPITEVAMGWYANLNKEFVQQFRSSLSKSEPIAIEAKNILDKIDKSGSVSDTELFKVCFILLLFGSSEAMNLESTDEREPEDSKSS